MNTELLQFAEALCIEFNASVISWGRTAKHNKAVGGVDNSWHRWDRGANAVDLKPDDPKVLPAMEKYARAEGYQVKLYARSMHIEVPW